MNNNIIQLNEFMQVSNAGHILYFYEDTDSYVENAVSFIIEGIEQGHHLLIIENKPNFEKISQKLTQYEPFDRFDNIHFFDNHDFYGLHGDFHCETILQHSSEILKPFIDQMLSVRTWSNIEWEQAEDIISQLEHYEHLADQTVARMGLMSVCAYNGSKISVSLLNAMLKSHEYYMTDQELMRSPLYMKRTVVFPSLSIQNEQKENFEQEINNHRATKKKLKATKYQLEAFITKNLDPVLIFNDDNKLIRVNDAFEHVFGWKSAEILGIDAIDLPHIPAGKKTEASQNQEDALAGRIINGYESIRINKMGTELNVMVQCFPLRDEKDKANGWAAIIRDITEQKQAQELLIRTEKLSMAGELAAGIAHEIRNPLTAVKGFLQLIRSGRVEKDTYYEIMSSEIERIDLILSELLMLAKPQAANFRQTNLASLIKEVVTLLDAQANLYNVQIITEAENDDIYINCESNQIKQVCINFIKNAIEAMPNGGEMKIKLERGTSAVMISFIDQGGGMPQHVLSRLGQPFYTTKEKGTGLGFMVSKKIIENHNGSVQVFSVENKGTTIEINMPYESV